MRSVPVGLAAELGSAAPRMALALLIERADGLRLAATTADRRATLSGVPINGTLASGVVFDPSAGGSVSLSAIARTAGGDVDNLEATVLAGGVVTMGDVLQGRWAGAAWTLLAYSWANPGAGVLVYSFGEVGKVSPVAGAFKFELRDVRQRLQANTTWVTQKDCRWEFGSTALPAGLCGKDLTAYTFDAVPVTAVTSARQFTLGSLSAETAGFFSNGLVTFDQSATGATTDSAGYAVGASVINLASAGTGRILATDTVTFPGDDTEYTVTVGDTDVSNGGSITIAPPLVRAIPAAATALTVSSNLGGITVRIREHQAGGVIVLDVPLVFEIPVGITLTIVGGCLKRWDVDCRDLHDNLRRFGGEKDAPSPDKALNMKVPT